MITVEAHAAHCRIENKIVISRYTPGQSFSAYTPNQLVSGFTCRFSNSPHEDVAAAVAQLSSLRQDLRLGPLVTKVTVDDSIPVRARKITAVVVPYQEQVCADCSVRHQSVLTAQPAVAKIFKQHTRPTI